MWINHKSRAVTSGRCPKKVRDTGTPSSSVQLHTAGTSIRPNQYAHGATSQSMSFPSLASASLSLEGPAMPRPNTRLTIGRRQRRPEPIRGGASCGTLWPSWTTRWANSPPTAALTTLASRRSIIEASTVAAISASRSRCAGRSASWPWCFRRPRRTLCRYRQFRGRAHAGGDIVHRKPASAVWRPAVILLLSAFSERSPRTRRGAPPPPAEAPFISCPPSPCESQNTRPYSFRTGHRPASCTCTPWTSHPLPSVERGGRAVTATIRCRHPPVVPAWSWQPEPWTERTSNYGCLRT